MERSRNCPDEGDIALVVAIPGVELGDPELDKVITHIGACPRCAIIGLNFTVAIENAGLEKEETV